ncbi:MAG: type II secretion system F family protein [Bdellovibrionales bacterium]|nr:type II secretion system F family protein [Bdellovibrionales bacterium]
MNATSFIKRGHSLYWIYVTKNFGMWPSLTSQLSQVIQKQNLWSFLSLLFIFLFSITNTVTFEIHEILYISLMLWLFPLFCLFYRKKKLKVELEHILPFYLDLISVNISSGYPPYQVLQLIAKRVQNKDPFGSICQTWIQKKSQGLSSSSINQTFVCKIENENLMDLFLLIEQSEQSGNALAPSLRSLSKTCWDQWICRLETKAQKAPIKVLFPLLIFIFPVIFILLFVPLAQKLMSIQ